MENSKASARISCPIHPSEIIQRVDTDVSASQQLYCMECILQNEDSFFDRSKLKSIAELIDSAANHYQLNKDKAKLSSDVPSDYTECLSNQAESLERLSKHIEEEKKKVEFTFDIITKDFLRLIEDKKNEYLYSLDQQLFNLRYWYIFFDKQIKKAYPTAEDLPFLFPSKEELTGKLQKISNATQLMAFVRNLKEDLNEQKLLSIRTDQKTYLNTLKSELAKVESAKPYFSTEDYNIPSLKAELKKSLEEALEKLLVLENPIKDVVKNNDFGSKLINAEQFELLRKWVPKNLKFNLKMLYRASKDGTDAASFHKHCDGKGATITIIKCQFNGSSKQSIIGGFLDQSWSSTGGWLNSSKAFIFSITNRVTCPVSIQTQAAYAQQSYGPTFGGGHDLCVNAGNQNYVNPNSFTNTSKIVDTANYTSGQAHFKVTDVEVYLIN